MILESLKTKNDIAFQRIQTSITDSYEDISIFSVYWESDNTGSREYSDLFILLQLFTVKPYMKALSDKDWVVLLINEVTNHPQSQPNSHQLFILHYAGHARADSTFDDLIIFPVIICSQEIERLP